MPRGQDAVCPTYPHPVRLMVQGLPFGEERAVNKGFVAARAAMAVAAFLGQVASAKTLEDVLKEKGVITEEDYKQVTSEKQPDHMLQQGFTLTSVDDKFSLTMGGFIQPRYSYAVKDDGNPVATQRYNVSEFRVRRAKLVLSGFAIPKDLTYKLQVEFAQIASEKLLDDAFISYRIADEVQIRGGQAKVSFSRQWLAPGWGLEFIERSVASDAFYAGRDIGVELNGKIRGGLVSYAIGGYGGAGQGRLNSTTDNAIAARVEVSPLGKVPFAEGDVGESKDPLVSVGADYYRRVFVRNTTPSTSTNGFSTNNVQFIANNVLFTTPVTPNGWLGRGAALFDASERVAVNTCSVDAVLKWRGLAVQGEYYYGQATGETSNNTLRASGYYGQAGYMVVPGALEVAFRVSVVDPDRTKANDIRTDVQGVVNYYLNKQYLRLQGEFTNVNDQSTGGTNDQIFRVQAQLLF